jgi:hypothetical protein
VASLKPRTVPKRRKEERKELITVKEIKRNKETRKLTEL